MLERKHDLRETLSRLKHVELTPPGRFWFGSPCRLVRGCDILTHIALPELLENIMPKFWLIYVEVHHAGAGVGVSGEAAEVRTW